MSKRRRGAIESSDESEEEPEAAVNTLTSFESVRARKRRLRRKTGAGDDEEVSFHGSSDNDDDDDDDNDNDNEDEENGEPSNLSTKRLRSRSQMANYALPDENSAPETDSASGDATPRFPVVLRTNSKRKQVESDDNYSDQLSSSDASSASDASEAELEYSDGGFLVDSDDNVVPKSSRPRTRRQRRQIRQAKRAKRRLRRAGPASSDDEFSASDHSLAEELRELNGEPEPVKKLRHYRERAPVNYAIPPPPTVEEIAASTAATAAATTAKKPARARRLHDVGGPFGGQDAHTIFAVSPIELERVVSRGKSVVGAIDRAAAASTAPFTAPNNNAVAGDRGDSADVDPVDVANDVDFSMVGGLDDYIAKLKEMVSLPLLYPELYAKFGITPPRGVLFHGPPGTGKTLMARALAASHRQEKVTFYMRKGADVLSKWVGESERQLRALFEEAEKNQPSIIFFDEIDGLAPVRSARQEQHHASIVSTLLALMDGMADRGQVVIIGATNRPDSVDPALRRPGRFDREFYFPLPNFAARRRILEIHTAKWQPQLDSDFLDRIASQTKGFGGADLRAVATEAALLAIQRAYPQIYGSSDKLLVDPQSILVKPQDFALALESIQPSTARQAGLALAQPLPVRIAPLLQASFGLVKDKMEAAFPRENGPSARPAALFLNERQFEQAREVRQFQQARVHRPRLLLVGETDSGQNYLLRAAAHLLEGVYIRELSFSTMFSAGSVSPESAIVSLVAEARQRAPACLLLPDLDEWQTAPHLENLLAGLLKSLMPSESVFVLGTADSHNAMSPLRSFFGAEVVEIRLDRGETVIEAYFAPILAFVNRPPPQCRSATELPREALPALPVAPSAPSVSNPKPLPAADPANDTNVFSASERAELRVRSQLKLKLGVILDGFRQRYRRFRKPVVEDSQLAYLFETATLPLDVEKLAPSASNADTQPGIIETAPSNSETVASDGDAVMADQSMGIEVCDEPYRRTTDNMIMEMTTHKKYFNMDLETVEDRLWNGFYCEPAQFLADMEMIYHDSVTLNDRERMHKASEMLANAQIAIDDISLDKAFIAACQELHAKDAQGRLKKIAENKLDAGVPANETASADSNELVSSTEPEAHEPAAHEPVSATVMFDPVKSAAADSQPSLNTITKTELAEEIAAEVVTAELPTQPAPIAEPEITVKRPVEYDSTMLRSLNTKLSASANTLSLDELEQLYATLTDIAWRHRNEWDRTNMIQAMLDAC